MLELLLDELLGRFLVYFNREAVRSQFDAIITAVVLSIIIARVLIFFINRLKPRFDDHRSDRTAQTARYGLHFGKWLAFPIVALILLQISLGQFLARNDLVGVIEEAIYIFELIFIYRLGLAVAYMLFDEKPMRRFHYRLIGPLFTLFILYEVMSDFVRFSTLAEIVLIDRIDDPLTIGTLFVVVVGLYFWIDSVIGFGEIIRGFTARYTAIPPGKLEGSLTLARYLLIGVGIYFGLTNLGLDTTTVAAVTAGLSVGVGFGLKEVLSNFISGIILLFEGSIQPGDILTLHNDRADVQKLGIRATVVSTDDETEIIIPNQELFTSQVIQRTGSNDFIRTIIRVRASYKDDANHVIKVLMDTCLAFEKLDTNFKMPKIAIERFDDHAIIYRIQVWSNHRVIGPIGVRLYLNQKIYEAFRDNNIEMPYPQADIHLKRPLALE